MGEKPSAFKTIGAKLRGLSLREQVMIWVFVLLVLIMCAVFFLLLPADERLNTAADNYLNLQSQETSTRLTIATIPQSQKLFEDSQARYAEYILKYQAPMLPEDIDRMITTLIEDCGFTASSLTLHPYATEDVAAFSSQAPSWELPNPEIAADADAVAQGAGDGTAGSAPTSAGEATGADAGTAAGASADGSTATAAGDSAAASATPATAAPSVDSGGGSGQTQVFAVEVSVLGYEDSFFQFLDRTVPLTWLKVLTTSYTPPTYDQTGYYYTDSTEEQTYSFNLKIYVHPEATVKNP
jgi:hypothetical protein